MANVDWKTLMGRIARTPLTHCARRRAIACVGPLLLLAGLLAVVPLAQPAGAQPAPPPSDCSVASAGVVVKLAQSEDRAAANMLAEAIRARGDRYCLIDAFASNARSTAAGLGTVYVVGGTRAISDPHMRSTLGRSSYTRIWGHDRWQTQSEVAQAILAIADGGLPRATPTSLPPTIYTNDCQNTVVLVKLAQREDRAAANMLAEAIRIDGRGRCLVDAFGSGARSEVSGRSVCVVGGTAAISNNRLTQIGLDPSDAVRVAGADRWATQEEVAGTILDGARCENASAGDFIHLVVPAIADDAGVAFERLPQSIDRSGVTIKAYYCGISTARRDAARRHVAQLQSAFIGSDLHKQLEHNNYSLDFEWGGSVRPSIGDDEAWNGLYFDELERDEKYCWPAIMKDDENATQLYTLIMTDVEINPDPERRVAGFAILGEGPSYMVTREELANDNNFQSIALHEVTHALYELWHIWGRDNDPKCGLYQLDDHDKQSILSYAKSNDRDHGCERRMTLAASYLACGMLMLDAHKDNDPYFQIRHRHPDFINKEVNKDLHYRYGGLNFYDTREECIADNNGKGDEDDTSRPVRKPEPSGALTISWGGDATQQQSADGGQIFCSSVHGYPTPYTCRNLSYNADREVLGEPYEADRSTPRWRLTCGIDGQAYQPFYWAGDSSTGCLYYAGLLGKSSYSVWVEINGYRSNEITWPPTAPECDPLQRCYEDDDPELFDEIGQYYWLQPDGNAQNSGYDHDFWFTVAFGNSDVTDNWARWDFPAVDSGTYDVTIHIPTIWPWATAHCRYVIKRNGRIVDSVPLDQQMHSGWTTLGTYNLSGNVQVEVFDNDCLEDFRDSGVGVENSRFAADAIRLQEDDRTVPPPPVDPELMVQRGNVKTDEGSCPASAQCRWVIGSGSEWPAGDQFWIKCGDFVDTSRDKPVQYRDRFVDASGNLSWGERICYSADSHTVEVWTSSGARKVVTIR